LEISPSLIRGAFEEVVKLVVGKFHIVSSLLKKKALEPLYRRIALDYQDESASRRVFRGSGVILAAG
jgi:hypothetical protein